ncbi:MAG: BsuBI/PstI family type II restriction endonuclease, partial [Trebonia sp.]
AVYEGGDLGAGAVGFENHLNVFHCRGRGLDEDVARGLCLWLNGNPSPAQLAALGSALGDGSWPDQEKVDSLVEIHVLYLVEIPGLRDTYARARDLHRIPVTLPGGSAVTLSPGGQNRLLKQMVEGFCGYFTPGVRVLYIGDADAKWQVFEERELAALGVTFDQHGKMPDLVVHMADRDWLVLLEAVSSHGPVDAKRQRELAHLFAGSTAGLVYVSCFPSREEMRPYLAQIAWETEVWCADNPTHLIHFNGERFLGPY